jgi:hypothetical protein
MSACAREGADASPDGVLNEHGGAGPVGNGFQFAERASVLIGHDLIDVERQHVHESICCQ